MKNILIRIGLMVIVVGLVLAIGGMRLHKAHLRQQIRTSLVEQIKRYTETVATDPSNVVAQCSDGCWLGRVRFLDNDWVGVAHHSRHSEQDTGRIGDVTVVLASDGTFYETDAHYCRDFGFELDLSREIYSNRTHFLTDQFRRPLIELKKDFEPTNSPYSSPAAGSKR